MNSVLPRLVDEATRFLQGRIRRTPLERSRGLSRRTGAEVRFKLECLQLTGSFKIRGAWFRLSRLEPAERRGGVATCSAGNHGKALAHVAAEMGIAARIYLPRSVDRAKLAGIEQLGARVELSQSDSYDETEIWARQQATARGLPFISAFEDPAVIAGNGGTLAREILADRPDVANIVIPVGGGGLAAGLCAQLDALGSNVRVFACQHARSPSLALSLQRGEAVTRMPPIETLAGGIEGGIGRLNFALMRDRVHPAVALLEEQEIYQAVRWVLAHHQYLIEPSAAVTVAALLCGRIPPLEGPTAVVLSGRNVDLPSLRRIVESSGESAGQNS